MSTAPAPLLVVDADRRHVAAVADRLRAAGADVATAHDPAAALAAAPWSAVLADVDAASVAAFVAAALARHPRSPVVIMSAHPSIAAATAAFKAGAADYLSKPLTDAAILSIVARAALPPPSPAIATRDPAMLRILDTVAAVADSRTTVLITGESGTGKSVLARHLHAVSPRRDRPFVEVSCGALPESLLESELFGHVKGAFTGAVADKPGRFVAADGGTLFLDEINSATPALQVKLLRVLQERALEPVGSNVTRTVDVRLVLAANVDLATLVAAGQFRQDLYYRINVVAVRLPPLRDRPADVPLLADRFVQRFRAEANRPAAGLTAAAATALARYAWPGNIRELENAIERAVVLGRRPLVDVDDLPDVVRTGVVEPPTVTRRLADVPSFDVAPLTAALQQPERQIIEAALRRNGWNRQRTADELDINRTTLYKKMLKFGLDAAAG